MSFQGPNQDSRPKSVPRLGSQSGSAAADQDPTYIAPQDRASDPNSSRSSDREPHFPEEMRSSLQPADWTDRAGPAATIKRDKLMDWKPDVFLDAQEWIQRAGMGDEQAIREVCLTVAPALLAALKKARE